MLNAFWIGMLLIAVLCAALSGRMDAVATASTDSAKAAVELAIGLVGVMAFWIGLMRVLQQAGITRVIAMKLAPVMRWLFPDVPADHPAMSMMIMNMTANMLGLGNAATPFGLKAMQELDKLNEKKGTATNAMALFLAINTSNVALLPTGMIALRASLGSKAAGSILIPTLIATSISTAVAIIAAKFLSRLPSYRAQYAEAPVEAPAVAAARSDVDTRDAEETMAIVRPTVGGWRRAGLQLAGVLLLAALGYGVYEMAYGTPAALLGLKTTLSAAPSEAAGWGEAGKRVMSLWALPLLIIGITFIGMAKGVKVYDCIVEGGKEGFQIALRIIPYLVAILVVVGMLRASGAIALMVAGLEDITALVGMPAEALPMALLRPLSGSGAYAVAGEIMQTHGPDSLVGMIVSVIQGSTETTFYVLALYFGVVQVRRVRHTLAACLIAEVAGVLGSVWAVRLFT